MNVEIKDCLKELGYYAMPSLKRRTVVKTKALQLEFIVKKNKTKSIGSFKTQSELERAEKLFRAYHKEHFLQIMVSRLLRWFVRS